MKAVLQRVVKASVTISGSVATGEFGADMMVHIENDGPLTIVLDDRDSAAN
jgi:D-Tyr-tRNAtyr deacylase